MMAGTLRQRQGTDKICGRKNRMEKENSGL